MGERGPKDRGPKKPRVVRRSKEDRRRLPADLEAFAGGDDDAIWRRPSKRRIHDPRPVLLVPGVANRDARAVCDARTQRARDAIAREDRDTLALELREAAQLGVWRGHSIVAWDAWVENVLGLGVDEADALRGDAELAPEPTVATWMRAEAGLIDAFPEGAVRLVEGALHLELPLAHANAALAAMGRRAAPLAKDQHDAPDHVVDRPKGVRPLSQLIVDPEDER